MNDNVTYFTKEQIKEQYQKFYEEHKHPPTIRDLRKYDIICDNTVKQVFKCGYSKALVEMGFKPNRVTSHDVTPEQVVQDYFNTKERIGKRPQISSANRDNDMKATYYDWNYYCCTFFGSYFNFLKMLNESIPKVLKMYERPTKKELFENYEILKNKYKETYTPSISHKEKMGDEIPLKIMDRSEYHSYQYQKVFGSITKFRKEYKKWVKTME